MSAFVALVKITATGEVRDKDGNLISSEPIEAEIPITQAQLDELTKGEN
jgi:hypothetical protein